MPDICVLAQVCKKHAPEQCSRNRHLRTCASVQQSPNRVFCNMRILSSILAVCQIANLANRCTRLRIRHLPNHESTPRPCPRFRIWQNRVTSLQIWHLPNLKPESALRCQNPHPPPDIYQIPHSLLTPPSDSQSGKLPNHESGASPAQVSNFNTQRVLRFAIRQMPNP